MQLAFEAIGAGPPLIVLHGLFASAATWRGVAGPMAETHRVYCVDLRNHGGSPRASSMAYVDMADDVLRLIEQQGLDRPAVLGHSMGGKVAMALALMHPYAVGALTIVDIAPVTYLDRWSHQLQRMRDTFAGNHLPDATAGTACSPSDGLWSQLTAPRIAACDAYVDWRANLGAIGLSIQELCAFPRHLRYLSSDVPLHAIVGGRSDCVSPANPAAFAPMFSRVTVDVIAQAGHWVHADRPDALLRSLRRAWSSRPRRGGAAVAAL